MLKNYLVLLLSLVIGISMYGQSSIYGTVTDEAGEPISGADVFIDNSDYYYMTEGDGTYILEVEPGDYVVTVSTFGFEEKKGNLSITTNEQVEWNVILQAQESEAVTTELEGIVITGTTSNPENEAAALSQQKKSDIIIEQISGGEISRKGISDAGEAVKSVVGISKEEGSSNVYVRGLSDRYQNTTLNGLPIPSNDSEKKNIDLDLLGSGIMESVAVSKTYSAKFTGDFAAGNVNINTKEQRGNGFQFEVGVGAGINSTVIKDDNFSDFRSSDGVNHFGYYRRYSSQPYSIIVQKGMDPVQANEPVNHSANISLGNAWKFEDKSKFSFLLSGSFSKDFTVKEGVQGYYTASKIRFFPNTKIYNSGTSSTAMANISYSPSRNQEFSFVSLFVNNSADAVGYFGLDGQGYQADIGPTGYFAYQNEFKQTRIFTNQLLGENELTDNLSLEWGIGYNYLMSDIPDRKRILLLGYGTNDIDFDANLRNFGSQRFFLDMSDEEIVSRFEFNYDFNNSDTKLKFGYNGKIKNRDFESITYGIGADVNAPNGIDVFNFNDIFNLDNFSANFDNSRDNVFEYVVIRPLLSQENVGSGYRNNTNFPGRPDAIYNGTMLTNAPYVQLELKPSDKWSIIPGVRYENFDQSVEWDVNNTTPEQSETEFDIWEFLPSLNVKYSPKTNLNFRLAGSRTISVPQFKEIAPFENIGVTTRVRGNPSLINPDLISEGSTGKSVSEVLNFDFKVELFPKRGELLSLALFYKSIDAPINLVRYKTDTNNSSYFRTGDNGTVYGVEVEAEKSLAEFGSGELSFGGNLSLSKSEQDLFPVITSQFASTTFNRKDAQLQGASPFIINADLSYDFDYDNGYAGTFTVAGSYFYDRVFALGSTGLGNQIEKGVPTLNVVWMNKISKNFEANLAIKNILNPEVEIVQEDTNDGDVVIESYKKGIQAGLSLKYKF